MSHADLTVIIPTYNGVSRGYINYAIDSVLSQTMPASHFFVVDDGSTDGTADQLRKRYPDLEILAKENQGLPATRNYAFRQVRTKYVAYLDDDDVWEPQKTAVQIEFLENYPDIDFVFCGITYIDERSRVTGVRHPARFGHSYPEILLGNSILPPSTVILKSDLVRKAGDFNESLRQGEDYEYFIRCARHGSISFVPEALVRYRRHNTQMSGNLSFIDDETYKIISSHVDSMDEPQAQRILRFFKYGAALRSLLRGDFSTFARNIKEAPGQLDLTMLLCRLVGIGLNPFANIKNAWRRFEYRQVLDRAEDRI